MRKRIKLLTIGSQRAGKSTLIKRYCEDRFFGNYLPTIGIDFGMKPIQMNNLDIRIDFFDTSGNDVYFEIRNEFYKDINGVILVYDVSNRRSFKYLSHALQEYHEIIGSYSTEIPIVLCANKTDKKPRQVSENEGNDFASSNNLLYFECSSKNGRNVSKLFQSLIENCLETIG